MAPPPGTLGTGERSGRMPALGPVLKGPDHRLQRLALGGELVADADSWAVLYLAADQTLGLELLQARGQKAVRHAGDAVLQLREAQRSGIGQRVEHGAGPAAADQLDGAVEIRAYVSGLDRRPGSGAPLASLHAHLAPSLPLVRDGSERTT